MKKILIVVGTRPNFIKITQFRKAAQSFGETSPDIKIVHTGQHYDNKMADVFFEQFKLVPDYFLDIPAAAPVSQMAEVMQRLEPVIKEYKPDMMTVVGDVNSTLAAAVTANKMDVRLAHIESGLRSFDRTMPEENNRILTDLITDYCFITEQSGMDNLLNEGHKPEQLHFVGNTMIDTMVAFEDRIQASDILNRLGLKTGSFVLMTMHRPATVDHPDELKKLLKLIGHVTEKYKLVFPIHPRTVKQLQQFNMMDDVRVNANVILTDPMGYFDFQKLIADCKFILTDSGGIQEESTFRQVPCITLRPNTERPSTIDLGTNTLLPFELEPIEEVLTEIEEGTYKKGSIPPLWDGHATERILDILH